MLFDLLKAFVQIESYGIFSPKSPVFLHACVTCSELSSNIITMFFLFLGKSDFAAYLSYVFMYILSSSRHAIFWDQEDPLSAV